VPRARHHSVTTRSLWLLSVLGTICRHHFVEFIPMTLSDANFSFCFSLYSFLAFLVLIVSCILLGALVLFAQLLFTFFDCLLVKFFQQVGS